MGTAYWLTGEAREVLAALPPGSIDAIVTSPPYLAKRDYLPADDPAKAHELGMEGSPAEFVGGLLEVMDLAWEVLADHGVAFVNLGDTAAGSGGAGGDYNEGGWREGQPTYRANVPKMREGTERWDRPGSGQVRSTSYPATDQVVGSQRERSPEESRAGVDRKNRGNSSTRTAAKARSMGNPTFGGVGPERMRTRRTLPGWPRDKSICWVPEAFGMSLAYGLNVLDPPRLEQVERSIFIESDGPMLPVLQESGQACRQWVTRPSVVWCKPNPTPGSIHDKFREATELIVFATKVGRYWFDLYPLRSTPTRGEAGDAMSSTAYTGSPDEREGQTRPDRVANAAGAPPNNWWVISNPGFPGAHYATFPTALVHRPIVGGCAAEVCKVCGKPRDRLTHNPQTGERNAWGRAHDEPGFGDRPDTAERVHLGWSECGCGDGCVPTVIEMVERKPVVTTVGECHDPAHWRPGRVLDPFAGSGTVGEVATAHGRDAILVDLDRRNAELAAARLGMWLREVTLDELVEILTPDVG